MLSTRLENHDGCVRLRLSGRFDVHAVEAFRRAFVQMMATADAREYVINFAGLDYIDSRALGLLIHSRSQAAAKERKIVLEYPQKQVLQAFNLANLKKLFVLRLE